MNNTEMTEMVIQKIRMAQENKIAYEVFFSQDIKEILLHEFLFFIKPEITMKSEQIDLKAILDRLFGEMEAFKLRIVDARIISADYLKEFNIIAMHYGVINSLSRHAKEMMSAQAVENFKSSFGLSISSVKMSGSLEFLDQHPEFNPVMLDELWQSSQTVKLAPGTYCAKIDINQEEIYLVNGFHPRQLSHYTETARSIVAFTLTGKLNWKTARNDFIGKTNPSDAKPGSLRNDLYVNKDTYGLSSVSPSWNGYHLSAGPVEGLVELTRYNSNHLTGELKTISDFTFGKILADNFNPDQTKSIIDNKNISHHQDEISVFDLTEEKDAGDAIRLLKECQFD